MLLSQVFSPFAYAVTGEKVSIEELPVVEVVEEPEVVETETNEETIEPENPVGNLEIIPEQLTLEVIT